MHCIKRAICLVSISFYSLQSISLCKSLKVIADLPYSSGTFTIFPNSAEKRIDTVSFSNGLKIALFTQSVTISVYPTPPYYTGVKVLTPDLLMGSGFKWDSGNTWQLDSLRVYVFPKVYYYSSCDTVWEATSYFPTSLLHFDSICNDPGLAPNVPHSSDFGKWMYITSHPTVMGGYHGTIETPVTGYKNIMYFNAKGSRMRLQVSTIAIIPVPNTFNAMYSIDSICFKWSIDSLGNGIFSDLPTRVAIFSTPLFEKEERPSTRIIHFGEKGMFNIYEENVTLFNLQGRRLDLGYNEFNRSSGMFINRLVKNITTDSR